MYESYPWNIQDCLNCPNWNGSGCVLTACCRSHTYIYIDGKLVEIGELEIEN